MITFEKSGVVDAPVEQVFAYLNDPTRQPEYMPGVDEVTRIQRLPDGRYTYTEVNKFLGLRFEIECEQTEVIPNERIVETMHGGGLDGVMSLRLEPLEGGKTRVILATKTTMHAGPLAKFGESFLARYFDHGTDMAMEAAKAHLEAGAVAATPS